MSRMAPHTGMDSYPPAGYQERRYDLAPRDTGGPALALLAGVAAVVGNGLLPWYYFGPDLVRYLKIRDR
jgi:hypothetical protein